MECRAGSPHVDRRRSVLHAVRFRYSATNYCPNRKFHGAFILFALSPGLYFQEILTSFNVFTVEIFSLRVYISILHCAGMLLKFIPVRFQ
jgi:hypothetical protein